MAITLLFILINLFHLFTALINGVKNGSGTPVPTTLPVLFRLLTAEKEATSNNSGGGGTRVGVGCGTGVAVGAGVAVGVGPGRGVRVGVGVGVITTRSQE